MEITKNVPDDILQDTFTDEKGHAELIAYPETTEDVQAFIKEANENNKKVIPIGAHTGVVSATLARNNEQLLSLKKMNKIIELDEETLTLTVESGVTLHQIREYLEDTPYFYAPDPGSKDATVGGNAATNAGGMRALKYGVTRDNIRSLEVVLPSGELVRAGTLNMKSSSGYDLKNLFIGSEGTLGVITKLNLRLLPKPAYERSLILSFDSLEDLAPVIYKILSLSITPSALEFYERKGIELTEAMIDIKSPEVSGDWFILLTVDGQSTDIIDEGIKTIADLAKENGASGAKILSGPEAKNMWLLRDNLIIAIKAESEIEPYDIVVPINQITDTILEITNITKEMGLKDAFFGHAGDGNIHANLLRGDLSDEEWSETVKVYNDQVYKLVVDKGGLPSAEHGIGLMKKKYLKLAYTPGELQLMRQIKQAFDPNNTLNPNKVIDFVVE